MSNNPLNATFVRRSPFSGVCHYRCARGTTAVFGGVLYTVYGYSWDYPGEPLYSVRNRETGKRLRVYADGQTYKNSRWFWV